MTENANEKNIISIVSEWLIISCLLVKPLIFYELMGFRINFIFIWAASAVMLLLLFSCFNRLWIPFLIYIAVTALMFADVTFNAYFNGYLSVGMLGSTRYLGDVKDIIIEIIRPEFFLLLSDFPVMIFALIKLKMKAENTGYIYIKESGRRKLIAFLVMTGILSTFLLGSLSGSAFLQSVSNLEFFSYHIKDVLNETVGFDRRQLSGQDIIPYKADKNDRLFGIAEGRNLIVIQMEALQNFVINTEYEGQEITPELNRLISDRGTLYFDHYYMQIATGNTSDAEFATNNSLYGTADSYTYEIYKENTFRGLPVLLKEKGYDTIAMHGYEGSFWSRDVMYPAQGFDRFIDDKGYELTEVSGWGIADKEFYRQSVSYLKDLNQPFYSFLVSLSNHTPFKMKEEYCRINLLKKHEESRFGNYLNGVAYSDYAIGVLIEELKKAGLYENSIIAIYGDHFGLAQNDENNEELLTEFLGKPYRFDEMANIPLIIHIPGKSIRKTVSVAGGQMDFLPTIAYLMGFETLDTLYLGQNLLTAKRGFVIQNRYAPAGSFITDGIIYFMSMDGVFENGKAWDTDTGEELPLRGLEFLSERSAGLINESEQYLKEDAIASWDGGYKLSKRK